MTINRTFSAPEGPILLLGGTGMLGRAWFELLRSKNIPFDAPNSTELDITNTAQIGEHLTARYTAVVNCAALANVDQAEMSRAAAYQVNALGVASVAQRCADLGVPLVHYSSDYVFDGRSSKPYRPDHPCNPINAYGRSKLMGEVAVHASRCSSLTIRTSWLFAPWGRNFIRTIVERLHTGSPLRVIADQVGRPTSAQYLAEASLRLLSGSHRGTWHVANNGACSWYELAVAVAEEIDATGRLDSCTSAEYPLPAERPKSSILDLGATQGAIGLAPHWRSELTGALVQMGAITPRCKSAAVAL